MTTLDWRPAWAILTNESIIDLRPCLKIKPKILPAVIVYSGIIKKIYWVGEMTPWVSYLTYHNEVLNWIPSTYVKSLAQVCRPNYYSRLGRGRCVDPRASLAIQLSWICEHQIQLEALSQQMRHVQFLGCEELLSGQSCMEPDITLVVPRCFILLKLLGRPWCLMCPHIWFSFPK